MNCPKCHTPLILLQEGKPPILQSRRKHLVNLWGCQTCNIVLFPDIVPLKQNPSSTQSEQERLSRMGFLTFGPSLSTPKKELFTLTQYQQSKINQKMGNMDDEDLSRTFPHDGTEIYVPTLNKVVIGGLATVEEFLFLGRWKFAVEEHPNHIHDWGEIGPIQETLRRQFEHQRAHVITPHQDIPQPGDVIYLEQIHRWTDYYGNESDEGYKIFSNLPGETLIPWIRYFRGGKARIFRISPTVNTEEKIEYYVETEEREGFWYAWNELVGRQHYLKEKFGDQTAIEIHDSIDPEIYGQTCIDLFGFTPSR